MTDDDQNKWVEIYELERWNDQAREMILQNEARITELKSTTNKSKDEENG